MTPPHALNKAGSGTTSHAPCNLIELRLAPAHTRGGAVPDQISFPAKCVPQAKAAWKPQHVEQKKFFCVKKKNRVFFFVLTSNATSESI